MVEKISPWGIVQGEIDGFGALNDPSVVIEIELPILDWIHHPSPHSSSNPRILLFNEWGKFRIGDHIESVGTNQWSKKEIIIYIERELEIFFYFNFLIEN